MDRGGPDCVRLSGRMWGEQVGEVVGDRWGESAGRGSAGRIVPRGGWAKDCKEGPCGGCGVLW